MMVASPGAANIAPFELYLSRSEAATRLGVPPRTIQEWALSGKLPCIRTLGGHRRFLARDVDALEDLVLRRRMRLRSASGAGRS